MVWTLDDWNLFGVWVLVIGIWFWDNLKILRSATITTKHLLPFQQRMGDHQALDLIRSFKDLDDFGIPHHSLHRMTPRQPFPFEDLDSLCRYLHGYIRSKVF
jgi:hypothetical protein